MKDYIEHPKGDVEIKVTGRNRNLQSILESIDQYNYDSRVTSEQNLIDSQKPGTIVKLVCGVCFG